MNTLNGLFMQVQAVVPVAASPGTNWLFQQLPVVTLALICLGVVWSTYLKKDKAHTEALEKKDKAHAESLIKKDELHAATISKKDEELEKVYTRMADSEVANITSLNNVISCMDSVADGQGKTQEDVSAIKDLVLEKIDDLKTMIINGKTK